MDIFSSFVDDGEKASALRRRDMNNLRLTRIERHRFLVRSNRLGTRVQRVPVSLLSRLNEIVLSEDNHLARTRERKRTVEGGGKRKVVRIYVTRNVIP